MVKQNNKGRQYCIYCLRCRYLKFLRKIKVANSFKFECKNNDICVESMSKLPRFKGRFN